jgi:hypothetical protein
MVSCPFTFKVKTGGLLRSRKPLGSKDSLRLFSLRIPPLFLRYNRPASLSLALAQTRKAFYDNQDITHTFVDKVRGWGATAMTLHGRTRVQRYSRRADWEYVIKCAKIAAPTGLQLIGNGDIYSYEDYRQHMEVSRYSMGWLGPPSFMCCRSPACSLCCCCCR